MSDVGPRPGLARRRQQIESLCTENRRATMLLVCVRMVLKGTIRFAADVGRIQIGCEHPKHVELTFAQWFDQRLFDWRSGLSRVCQRSRGSPQWRS